MKFKLLKRFLKEEEKWGWEGREKEREGRGEGGRGEGRDGRGREGGDWSGGIRETKTRREWSKKIRKMRKEGKKGKK